MRVKQGHFVPILESVLMLKVKRTEKMILRFCDEKDSSVPKNESAAR